VSKTYHRRLARREAQAADSVLAGRAWIL